VSLFSLTFKTVLLSSFLSAPAVEKNQTNDSAKLAGEWRQFLSVHFLYKM